LTIEYNRALGDGKMNIFTYGSLMFNQVWPNVVSSLYEKIEARLYGYKRRKIKGEVYPAVIPGRDDDYVDGKIYLDVEENDINKLDRFEGEYYQKEMAVCKLPDESETTACVYVLKEQYRDLVEDEEWHPDWFAKFGIYSFLAEYKGFTV